MRVRALDVNGDWTFGKGRNNYLQGNDAWEQKISTSLKMFLGDCFFDLAAGIDWWTLLGAKEPLAIDYSIQTALTNIPVVTAITSRSVELDPTTRQLDTAYDITLAAGASAELEPSLSLSQTGLLTELGDLLTTEQGDPIGIEGGG